MASLDDVITQFSSANKTLGALVLATQDVNTALVANSALVQAILTGNTALVAAIHHAFPTITGSFTLTAAATLVVPQPAILANSVVQLIPTNAAAGTLQGSVKSLYISAIAPGVSFTVATASATNATGGETFSYYIVLP